MEDILKILYLEDNPYDAELVQSAILVSGITATFKVIQSQSEFEAEVVKPDYDLIFSDFSLPAFSGTKALEIAKQQSPNKPFIFISGTIGEDSAIESLLNGATDYVLKTKLSRLLPAVKRALKDVEETKARIRVQNDLIQSEERFRTLAENALALILIYNKKGIVYANPAALTVFSYSEAEIYSMNFDELASKDFRETLKGRVYKRLAGDKLSPRFEFKAISKDKKEIWLDSTSSRITYQGEAAGLVYMLDITEKKETEIALRDAKERAEEMSRIKSFFLSNVSHELRTPLNGIMGFAELIINDLKDEDKPKAKAIMQSASRLNETLNMIIDLSRLEANEKELKLFPLNITECAKNVIENQREYAEGKGLKICLESQKHNITAPLDSKMFSSVLTNLTNNAIKYTSQGSVELNISTSVFNGKEKAVIKIKDTGIGIEPDKLPVIFKEFRQGSEGFNRVFEGLGIGLTITKKFVELMNGAIDVTSKPGYGTEFTIKFNTANNSELSTGKKTDFPVKSAASEGRIMNVLIVEDEEINRSLARLLLRKTAKTEEAVNAMEAIEKCRNKLFDVVLMDINLGKGMNGLEAAREIKKINDYEKIPIVAVTAYTLDEDENKYLSEGCTHYLPKPYSQAQLLALLKEIAAVSNIIG